MRLVRTIETNPDGEETEEEAPVRRFRCWYVRPKSADDDSSKTAPQQAVKWSDHTIQVTTYVKNVAGMLRLSHDLQEALELAGKFHDLGKKRELWQRSIGHAIPKNPKPEDWLAKSGKGMKPLDIT